MEIWYYNREVQPYLSFCQLILGREEDANKHVLTVKKITK